MVTQFAPKVVESSGHAAFSSKKDVPFMLGQGLDGTLRSDVVFSEHALFHAPFSLDWLSAATLTVTWTTAWNALFGLEGKKAGPGTWVLVQRAGGVSTTNLQLAIAVGATVVATTLTEKKAARLKELGAAHTVNYPSNPDAWGREARSLTSEGRGFDIVVDIGGNQTLPQSLSAVRVDGVVMVVGGVGQMLSQCPPFRR